MLLTVAILCQLTLAHAVVLDDSPADDLAFLSLPLQTAPAPLHHRQDSASTTTAGTASTSSSIQIQIATPTSATLPRPFDASLGNNFTSSSCPAFFDSFLSNSTFQACLPFSLLLQTSTSFFTMSKSLVQISQTMDATCNVDYLQCSGLMSTLATQIRLSSNCGQDLQYQNPLVQQAYNGFLAYDSLYQAGCLKDKEGNYCYGTAMMNNTDPSTYYIYYLPLGVQLPSTAKPTCNDCLQGTMSIFAGRATNGSLPLSKDYVSAATVINSNCGSGFVDQNVNVSTSAAPINTLNLGLALIGSILAICGLLL